jgi:hypothetical protein
MFYGDPVSIVSAHGAYPDAVIADGPLAYWRLGESEGYAQAVLSSGPVGYWRLGESAGRMRQTVPATTRTGTYNGGVTFSQAGPLSDGTTAVLLNGSTGFVDVTNAAFRVATAVTVEAWVNIPAILGTDQTILRCGIVADMMYWLAIAGVTGKLYTGHNNGVSYELFLSPSAVPTGAWVHVAFTRQSDGKTYQHYVNGVAVGSAQVAVSPPTAAAAQLTRIGLSSAQGLTGSVDEVAIYSRALSAAEIANHYALRTALVSTVATTTVADSSGNGRTGTVVNGVTLGQTGPLADGNTAAAFDGAANSRINTTLPASGFGTGGATLEAWFKTTAAPVRQYIADNKGDASNNAGFNLATNPAGNVIGKVGNGAAQTTVSSSGTYNDGQWHHAVLVLRRLYDGVNDGVFVYVDGLQRAVLNNAAAGWDITPSSVLVIGTESASFAQSFTGSIDEVAVYNRALTDTEIAAHYTLRVSTVQSGGQARVTTTAPHGWRAGDRVLISAALAGEAA